MTDFATLWQTGNAHAAAANWDAAAACFQSLARRRPGDAAAWIALAKAWGLAGRHRGSRDAALAALAAPPDSWSHALALARLLRGHHEVQALIELDALVTPWLATAPIAELVEWADLLGKVDAHAQALARLDLAVARDPGHAPSYYLRGTTRLFLGRMDEAVLDLERAIELAPHFAHAHWRLTELRGYRSGQARSRVRRLQDERERVAAGSEHDIHFSFALHAELHDLGRHDEAWAALERGCRAKRATLRYDPAAAHRVFEAVQQFCSSEFLAGPGHVAASGPQPIFIVGQFRSGTTLVERILGGHSQVADGGETLGFTAQLRLACDYRGRDLLDEAILRRAADVDYAALGKSFLAASAWRARGRDYWTEKLPSNFMNLGLIARALPQARFVHMQRPAMDVCFSNLRLLYGGLCPHSYVQGELAAHYLDYRRLMTHWRELLGERLLDVDHGDLVRDPEREARRVMAHCRLPFEARTLAIERRDGAVSTQSAAQVRAGIRAATVSAWAPYREPLQPLLSVLSAAGLDVDAVA